MATNQFVVPITPGSPDGDPHYNERMIAKAEGRPFEPKAAEVKPEEVKPEVKTEEVKPQEDDYKKKYEELLAQQKKPEADPKAEKKDETTEEDPAKKALESKGLSMSEFQKEFTEKGELSPDSYTKLAEAGIDKETVDAYIEGRKAVAEAYNSKVFDAAGGSERYTEMVTWAKENLKAEDIAAYDAAVTSGDVAKAELAVKGLHSQFTEHVGEPPSGLLKATPGGGSTGDVFKSRAEMTAAISDPRYHKDPAYRKEVEAKVVKSKLF